MKKAIGIILAVFAMLVTLTSTVCFAGGREGADLSLANQWEQRGNFSKAGYHYDQAAQQETSLDKRAKLHQRSLKAYLKTDDFNSMEEATNRIRQYAKDGGTSLLKELAPNYLEAGKRQAKSYNNAKAYELLSFYLAYHQSERNKLADEFNARGNKDLAQMLNPALKAFDCKSMLTKADKATDDNEMFQGYSNLVSSCPGVLSFQDQQRIGRKVLDLAKRDAKRPGKEPQVVEEKKIAGQLIGDNVVESELPEIRIYEPGTEKIFELEAGEQLDHFIAFPYGITTKCDIGATSASEYIQVHKDGRIFSQKQAIDEIYPIFKFRATKKSKIRIRLSQ